MLRDEIEKILDKFTYQGILGHNKLIWTDKTRKEISKAIEERLVLDEGKISDILCDLADKNGILFGLSLNKIHSLTKTLSTAKGIITVKDTV